MDTVKQARVSGGKRSPATPLPVCTGDYEERDTLSKPDTPTLVSSAGELCDHDYDSVASPTSSTASGPVYIRPPGFQHHGQEIVATKPRTKKKKTTTGIGESLRDGGREVQHNRIKPKKDPLPMRQRALPPSFWQQPNRPHPVSPGTSMYPVLPPLVTKDTEEDVSEVRPVTPPDEKKRLRLQPRPPEREIFISDLGQYHLNKLFSKVTTEKKHGYQHKRGSFRQRKLIHRCAGTGTVNGPLCGNDPYLVDAVTEKLLPQLSLEGRHGHSSNMSLHLIKLSGEGERIVTLPSLAPEKNYSQILSELVTYI